MKLLRTNALEVAAGPMLAEAIRAAIARRGRCRIALSGGSTPRPTFEWLRRNLDPQHYAALWVTWADERQLPVAESDPWWTGFSQESNLWLAHDAWLGHVPPVARVLPLCDGTPLGTRRDEVARIFAAEWGGLDIAQLGVGPDGHVASLFPGHPGLLEPGPVVAVRDSPKPPPERLSLSLSVLQSAAEVVVMARGADKAPVLARAWAGDAELPLARLGPRCTWICDEAAARGLPEDA